MSLGAAEVCSQDLLDKLNWRYATKMFDPDKKIADSTWDTLEQALLLSASSYGVQPWKFIVITDPSLKAELSAHSFNQPQPKDCSHLLVICRLAELTNGHLDNYMNRIAQVRETSLESLASFASLLRDFKDNSLDKTSWMTNQCYIALGTLLTVAAMLKVDACPMEGFDKAAFDRVLKLPEQGLNAVLVCPLGYRAHNDRYAQMKKVRFPASQIVMRLP